MPVAACAQIRILCMHVRDPLRILNLARNQQMAISYPISLLRLLECSHVVSFFAPHAPHCCGAHAACGMRAWRALTA